MTASPCTRPTQRKTRKSTGSPTPNTNIPCSKGDGLTLSFRKSRRLYNPKGEQKCTDIRIGTLWTTGKSRTLWGTKLQGRSTSRSKIARRSTGGRSRCLMSRSIRRRVKLCMSRSSSKVIGKRRNLFIKRNLKRPQNKINQI